MRPLEGSTDPVMELMGDPAGEIAPREIGLDGDRAHRLEWRMGMVGVVDQHRVLVDLLALDLDEALAHRLDIADPGKSFCSAAKRPTDVVVLPSSIRVAADENPRRDCVTQHRLGTMSAAAEKNGIGHTIYEDRASHESSPIASPAPFRSVPRPGRDKDGGIRPPAG